MTCDLCTRPANVLWRVRRTVNTDFDVDETFLVGACCADEDEQLKTPARVGDLAGPVESIEPPLDFGEKPHPCIHGGCGFTVLYDDEPWCFTHSPDSGSSVAGYSYARQNERQRETTPQ